MAIVLAACTGYEGPPELSPAMSGTWSGTTTVTVPGLVPVTYLAQVLVGVSGSRATISGICLDGSGALVASGSGHAAAWDGSLSCAPFSLSGCPAMTPTFSSATGVLSADGSWLTAQGSGTAAGCAPASTVTFHFVGTRLQTTCAPPTATLYWRLQDASGTQLTCAAAGVAWVDVRLGAAPPVRFDCTQLGGTVPLSGLSPGPHPTTVEGLGPDGTTVRLRAQLEVTAPACGDSPYSPMLGEALLNVAYDFSPVDACHGGAIWFTLYDEVSRTYVSAVYPPSSDFWKSYFACPAGAARTPLSFFVPFGRYTLAWIQEVMTPLTSPSPAWQACGVGPFTIDAPGIANLPVTLTPWASPCPAYP
jgi:hypothetical protein